MISKGRALVRILGTAPSTSTLSEWHSTSELNPYINGSRLPAAYCFSLWFHLLYQELDYSNKNGNFKWVGVFSIPLFRAVDLALNRATFYLRPDQLLTGVSYV